MAESAVMRGTKLRVEPGAQLGAALSPHQRQIVLAAADGLTYAGIAERVGCAPDTVKNHVTVILAKLGAANLTHAVAIVIRRDLTNPPVSARNADG